MGFFTPQTTVVHIDGENRATVRKLTYGERQRIIDANMTVTGKGDMDIKPAGLQMAMLKLAIVSWEGPDFEGRPVTPENIEALPAEIADEIAQAMDAVNADLDEAEKKA